MAYLRSPIEWWGLDFRNQQSLTDYEGRSKIIKEASNARRSTPLRIWWPLEIQKARNHQVVVVANEAARRSEEVLSQVEKAMFQVEELAERRVRGARQPVEKTKKWVGALQRWIRELRAVVDSPDAPYTSGDLYFKKVVEHHARMWEKEATEREMALLALKAEYEKVTMEIMLRLKVCYYRQAMNTTASRDNDVNLPASRMSSGRTVLPILINGEPSDALPDTMSSANIMTRAYAAKIGAQVDTARVQIFMNACGKAFQSCGETVVDVAFPENPSKIWRACRFAVVEKCPAPLIMGDGFLRLTETLTKYRHRLKRLVGSLKKMWRVCYMNRPRQMLNCSVDGHSVMASADTGSDVDLISLDYAKSRAWKIRNNPEDACHVLLADGTEKKLAGYVDQPLMIGNTIIQQRFYILDGLMGDVLLGDETLDHLDAFNRFDDHFDDIPSEEELNICHNINWKEKIDLRLTQILQGRFPAQSAKEIAQQRFQRVGWCIVPSNKNIQAWQEAFKRALKSLDDREVTARLRASQEMARLDGPDLQRRQGLDAARREAHRKYTERIKLACDRFMNA